MSAENIVRTAGALAAAVFAASPAFAGDIPIPAPLLGAGAPALVLIGGAYYLARKLRRR